MGREFRTSIEACLRYPPSPELVTGISQRKENPVPQAALSYWSNKLNQRQ